jgi:sugar (pentulose or hexulose) kinase
VRWIGVDIGTTHIKAVAIDGRAVLATRTEPTPASADGGGVCRDPRALVETVRGVVRRVVDADGGGPVAAISVASVGEEVVLVDRHGRPLGPILAWFDPRGQVEARDFAPTPLHVRFPTDPTRSLFRLLWLARHRPAEVSAAAVALDVASFVLLTLGAPAMMDWSHASRTGLFDPTTTCWDAETLDRAGLRPALLPALVPSGTVVGTVDARVAEDLGLERSTRLVSGGHDHFVGAFGCGIQVGGDFYLSAGTSEAQLVLADGPSPARAGIEQGRFVDADHWYLHCATPSGHAYGAWRRLLYMNEGEAAVRSELAARGPAGCRVELDPIARSASLHDIPLTADRALVLRAVVEGAAMSSANVFERLAAAVPPEIARLIVAGHAADDPLWRSLRLGLIGRPMEVVRASEVTAIGAALLARKGVTGDLEPFITTDRFAPSPNDIALADQLRLAYGQAEPRGATT